MHEAPAALSLYLLENIIGYSPDALISGLGYWFVRFTSRKVIGILLFVLYAGAVSNSIIEKDFQVWGAVMAIAGIATAEIIGRLRTKVRHRSKPPA